MAVRPRVLGLAVATAVVLVAAPAVVLTVARLTDGEQPLVVRLVAFTPLGIPLYALGLTLGVVRLGLGRHRARWAVLCTALLAGLLTHLAWIAPLYLGSTPAAAPGAAPLVVMNANMDLGQGDARSVVEAVRRRGVGLLVVEEVTPTLLARLDAAGLPTLLPHEAGAPGDQGHGTMVFAADPITAVAPVATNLGSWSMQVGGMRLLAVHPAFSSPPDTWATDQASVLRAVRTRHPDLLVGDLNATLDHTAVHRLEQAGLSDGAAQANAGWHPTWPANGLLDVAGLRPPPLVEIDHVMVAGGLAVQRFTELTVPDTDHRAVLARVVRRQ